MKPFATVDDLKLIYHGYKDDDKSRAEALLLFVSEAIASLCDATKISNEILKMVTCQVVIRMMHPADAGLYGVAQDSWSAAPYGGNTSFANPAGDIYLTAFEKQLLGVDDECFVTYVNQEV